MKPYVYSIIFTFCLQLSNVCELKAQETFQDTLTRVENQRKFYLDTLDLEYSGALAVHEKIVNRIVSYLYRNSGIHKYSKEKYMSLATEDARQRTFYPFKFHELITQPLVRSYLLRIETLAKSYIQNNYSGRYTNNEQKVCYRLKGGYNKFDFCDEGTDYYSMGVQMYLVITSTSFLEEARTSLLTKKDNDVEFIKLVSQAKIKGTKEVATVNGFYSNRLELRLKAALLLERTMSLYDDIVGILNSTNEDSYKIIHVVDAYYESKECRGILEDFEKKATSSQLNNPTIEELLQLISDTLNRLAEH